MPHIMLKNKRYTSLKIREITTAMPFVFLPCLFYFFQTIQYGIIKLNWYNIDYVAYAIGIVSDERSEVSD